MSDAQDAGSVDAMDDTRQHGRHGHGHGHRADADDASLAQLAELLDLDGEVLAPYLAEVTRWLQEMGAGAPVRRILDIGCGTGTGSFALLNRFPNATSTALDAAEPFLRRVDERAAELGLTERVQTVHADLDDGWPEVGEPDLVWASMSMHHMADPDRVLADVTAALRPGGAVVLAEMGTVTSVLPADIGFGRPGLEARFHAAMAQSAAARVPLVGADWAPLLEKAGLTVEATRLWDVNLTASLPPVTSRYARASLQRARTALADELDADDLATLDELLDDGGPHSVLLREDLVVRTKRTVWVARRAEG
jgi:SAM-dependent methyltransferase